MRLHLSYPFFMHCLMRKHVQNNSSNSGPDATLEGTLHGGVDVALEDAP